MKFKKGDICYYICPLATYIFIFKSIDMLCIHCYIGYSSLKGCLFDKAVTWSYNLEKVRLATEQEKKILFKALEKQGKYWDEEELKLISEL